jgi:hypothetical protein
VDFCAAGNAKIPIVRHAFTMRGLFTGAAFASTVSGSPGLPISPDRAAKARPPTRSAPTQQITDRYAPTQQSADLRNTFAPSGS